MKNSIKTSLLLLFLAASIGLNAQIEGAVTWDASLDKSAASDGEYLLVFKANISEGFHIYSAYPPEEVPSLGTFLEFDKESGEIQLLGEIEESGEKQVIYDDIFEARLGIFHHKAEFHQKVSAATTGQITGEILYQTCDDSRCIPGSYRFTFDLTDN